MDYFTNTVQDAARAARMFAEDTGEFQEWYDSRDAFEDEQRESDVIHDPPGIPGHCYFCEDSAALCACADDKPF